MTRRTMHQSSHAPVPVSRRCRQRILVAGIGLLGCSTPLWAMDHYVTPTGAGSQDGTSWANALNGSTIQGVQQCWDRIGPGEVCHVRSGTYPAETLFLRTGGTSAGARKTLRGEGQTPPVFIGSKVWPYTPDTAESGRTWIEIPEGVHHIRLQNMVVKHVEHGVLADDGPNTDLWFEGIAFENIRRGFELFGAREEITDVVIRNSRAKGFSKVFVRLRNVRRAEISHCEADSQQYDRDNFAIGFHVAALGTEGHHITFINCTARNLLDTLNAYHNGDGFTTERRTSNIRFINCRAFDASDAGFDIKTPGAMLINCIASRCARNFRFWDATQVSTMLCCFSGYAIAPGGKGSPAGLWASGWVRVFGSTFHNNLVGMNLDRGARVELIDSIVSADAASQAVLESRESGATVTYQDSVQWLEGRTGVDPLLENGGARAWEGGDASMNSGRYGPVKGYVYPLPKPRSGLQPQVEWVIELARDAARE